MIKTTMRELRRLSSTGEAIDATHFAWKDAAELARKSRTHIASSSDIYGLTGILFRDDEDGQLYVVVGRCTNLWTLC